MSATKIAVAFERWHKLWTGSYPTDEKSDAAAKRRIPIEQEVIATPSSGLPDVLAKVRMLREHAGRGKWIAEDEMLASIIADLEHATSTSPGLTALASEHAALLGRYNSGEGKDGVLVKQYERIFAKIEAFVPRSIADVLAKCRAGATNYGEGIAKKGEELDASDYILLQMIADLEHLAAAKVTA